MDNTIKNALNHIADSGIGGEIRHESTGVYRLSFDPAKLAASFVAYANQQCAPKDQRIAELEAFRIGANETCAKIVMDTKLLRDRIAELEKDAVLSADAIGLLQHDNARLEKENSDLRRALSECKAKARVGMDADRT